MNLDWLELTKEEKRAIIILGLQILGIIGLVITLAILAALKVI